MAVKSDINVPLITILTVMGALLLVVVLLATRAWYTWEADRLTASRNATFVPAELVELRQDQVRNVNRRAFSDDTRSAAVIPLARATDLLVRSGGTLRAVPPQETVTPAAGDDVATDSGLSSGDGSGDTPAGVATQPLNPGSIPRTPQTEGTGDGAGPLERGADPVGGATNESQGGRLPQVGPGTDPQ